MMKKVIITQRFEKKTDEWTHIWSRRSHLGVLQRYLLLPRTFVFSNLSAFLFNLPAAATFRLPDQFMQLANILVIQPPRQVVLLSYFLFHSSRCKCSVFANSFLPSASLRIALTSSVICSFDLLGAEMTAKICIKQKSKRRIIFILVCCCYETLVQRK
ncbi:uncharacterized protein FA14DRAFT_74973 [Meira miltonrushii]|uniref:Transmembrane protein n=1 Tax=Meira miltonrushii TaxID=1280837 RepID=A0A316V8K9_9BASI|nr:uncharacterized protein FA14DRAFT_74973 [Meira miltonrushii]PWN32523.1 hypothetical protein FA14DRAFT_74973 [Meira miltonrushii]